MLETIGNMWDIKADAYCITTNRVIKSNGKAVMGAGVALSALKKFPGCDEYLADFIVKNGHIVGIFYSFTNEKYGFDADLISFPTKYHWKENSDIQLIIKSSKELMQLVENNKYTKVVLPRPGCANGGLNWEDVKKEIQPILSDKIIIISL